MLWSTHATTSGLELWNTHPTNKECVVQSIMMHIALLSLILEHMPHQQCVHLLYVLLYVLSR